MISLITIVGFLLATLPDRTTALQISDYSDGQCIVSANAPVKPIGLEFCYWYNSKACCVPQVDGEAGEFFGHAVALGLSCSISKHQIKVTYNAIREWYCLGCDPDEPRYRYKVKKGDKGAAGGQHDPVPTASEDAVTWRICKSFLLGKDGNGGLWNKDGSMYDQCGFLTENPCGNGMQVVWDPKLKNGDGDVFTTTSPVLAGWDPFMCGDNLIIPSKQYVNAPVPVEAFLKDFNPAGFQDSGFSFVITDDTKADFNYDATPCFRGTSSALPLIRASSALLAIFAAGVLLIL
jgi:hypothetical protein